MMVMRSLKILALSAATAASVSCGDALLQSQAPVLLVMDSLLASRGASSPGPLTTPLLSDVITNVTTPAPCSAANPCPTVFNDTGQAVLRIVPKDISVAPSPVNAVTITRYRVTYVRSDGRNTPGVDVPFPFDGAVSGTVPPGGTLALNFELVRHAAKYESPLVQLAGSPTVITTIAEVVFFGQDQVGNEISVRGLIQVNFGNFGDS
jgi:hypothetical protein